MDLPERQRIALVLRYYADLSVETGEDAPTPMPAPASEKGTYAWGPGPTAEGRVGRSRNYPTYR